MTISYMMLIGCHSEIIVLSLKLYLLYVLSIYRLCDITVHVYNMQTLDLIINGI